MPTLRAALAAILVSLAAPACAAPPMWVVKDADSEMVLFGSVHILPPDLKWRTPALDAAVQAADDIWFEAPVDPASEAAYRVAAERAGRLPAGQSLSQLLPTSADRARLTRLARRYGLDRATLNTLKPWMAEVVLVQTALARVAQAYGDYGVEPTLEAAAPASAQRQAFATTAEHLALFDAQPMGFQLASLRRTLLALDRNPRAFLSLTKAWMAGDLAAIARQEVDPLRGASPELFERLVNARNAQWAARLDTRLKGRGRTVVVVGLGHLIGPGGLPERLRALGYSVTGP